MRKKLLSDDKKTSNCKSWISVQNLNQALMKYIVVLKRTMNGKRKIENQHYILMIILYIHQEKSSLLIIMTTITKILIKTYVI